MRSLLLLLLPVFAFAQYLPLGDPLALVNTSKASDGFALEDKLVPCNNKLVLIDLDSDASFTSFPPAFSLQACSASPASQRIQQFALDPLWGQLSLVSPPPYLFPQTCVDGGGVYINVSVYPWICRNASDPEHSNQRWLLSGQQVQSNSVGPKYPPPAEGPLCIAAGLPGDAPILEAPLVLAPCDPSSMSQAFSFNSVDGTLVHVPSGLCVDAGVIGRTVTWDGSTWRSKRIVPQRCPDAGNPALLPRDRVGTYTVGRTSIGGDPQQGDRLLIIGGDDSSNNVFWSDDCGTTWECYDGPQPWTTFGLSYAPILSLDALPGSPLIVAGGFINTPDGGVALNSQLFYTYDGGADTWLQGYDLPVSGVFPGSIAQDRSAVYVFGGAESGFAVWSVDENNYNTSGFALVPGSAFAQGADVGRRVFVRGAVSGGCWVACDFSPGDLWGGQREGVPVSSSNTLYVAPAVTGPWVAFPAPWTKRAGAAVVLTRDGTSMVVAGGLDFADGAPTGGALSDAWSVDATVCLLGTNGLVCSDNGVADVDTVTCACNEGYLPPTCEPPPSPSPTASPSPMPPSPTRSPTRSAAARTSGSATPTAGAGGGGAQQGLSPGAAAGIALLLIAAGLGAGLWLYAARCGGGPTLAALAGRVGLLRSGKGGERASLLAAPGSVPPKATGMMSASAAAARLGTGSK